MVSQGGGAAVIDPDAHLETSEAADVSNVAITDDNDLIIAGLANLDEQFAHIQACLAVQTHGGLDVIYGQHGAKRQPFRRDNITQFTPLGAFDFDVTLCNQPLEMLVNCANRNSQLGG